MDPFRRHSDAEVWNALRRSHVASAIEAMGGSLESHVAEQGSNLSVGARWRGDPIPALQGGWHFLCSPTAHTATVARGAQASGSSCALRVLFCGSLRSS